MSEVHTRDEAIASVGHAFATWATMIRGILTQGEATLGACRHEVEDTVRKRVEEVRALEILLDAARDERKSELAAKLRRANESLGRAKTAKMKAEGLGTRLASLHRSFVRYDEQLVTNARGELVAMETALGNYRSAGGDSNPVSDSPISTSGAQSDVLACMGFVEVDVAAADLDSNPILDDSGGVGTFGKGGLNRADYRWLVQTWNDTVGPGVKAGKTRDDFEAQDTQSNAQALRRTADVYDIFLGSNRIRADRLSGGSLDITNGRHRLLIARELGITTLPAEVR